MLYDLTPPPPPSISSVLDRGYARNTNRYCYLGSNYFHLNYMYIHLLGRNYFNYG